MVAVLVIWGTVAYKFVNGLSPDVAEIAPQDLNVSFLPKISVKVDTFSIKNIERDPFLGTLNFNNKGKSTSANTQKKVTSNFPNVTYGGVIKKQDLSDQVFVVNINKNQYLLKRGQIVDSVKLIRGNTNAIVVRYNNISKTIKRQ